MSSTAPTTTPLVEGSDAAGDAAAAVPAAAAPPGSAASAAPPSPLVVVTITAAPESVVPVDDADNSAAAAAAAPAAAPVAWSERTHTHSPFLSVSFFSVFLLISTAVRFVCSVCVCCVSVHGVGVSAAEFARDVVAVLAPMLPEILRTAALQVARSSVSSSCDAAYWSSTASLAEHKVPAALLPAAASSPADTAAATATADADADGDAEMAAAPTVAARAPVVLECKDTDDDADEESEGEDASAAPAPAAAAAAPRPSRSSLRSIRPSAKLLDAFETAATDRRPKRGGAAAAASASASLSLEAEAKADDSGDEEKDESRSQSKAKAKSGCLDSAAEKQQQRGDDDDGDDDDHVDLAKALTPLFKKKARGSKRPAATPAKSSKPSKAAKSTPGKATKAGSSASSASGEKKKVWELPPGWSVKDWEMKTREEHWSKYSTAYLLAWEWSWVLYKRKAGYRKEADLLEEMLPNFGSRKYIIDQLVKSNRDVPVVGQEDKEFAEQWRKYKKAKGEPLEEGEALPQLLYKIDSK